MSIWFSVFSVGCFWFAEVFLVGEWEAGGSGFFFLKKEEKNMNIKHMWFQISSGNHES